MANKKGSIADKINFGDNKDKKKKKKKKKGKISKAISNIAKNLGF